METLNLTTDQIATMRLALLTLRDEFSVIVAECEGLPGRAVDKRDREIVEWHAREIERAEELLEVMMRTLAMRQAKEKK